MKPGVYTDIDEATYHADCADAPSLSASITNIMRVKCPASARWAHPRLNPQWTPDEASNEMDFGSAAHALFLEGKAGLDKIHVVRVANKEGDLVTDYKTDAAQAERDDARANHLIPLLPHKWELVQAMTDAGREQINAKGCELRGILDDGDAEVTLIWEEEPGYGLPKVRCRSRLDFLTRDRKTLIDYKTRTGTAEPDALSKAWFNEGWDVQVGGFYRRGVQVLAGVDARVIVIAQETDPPFLLSITSLPPQELADAEYERKRAVLLWAKCLHENDWPGYPKKICYVEQPAYITAQREAQRQRDVPPTREQVQEAIEGFKL